MKYDHGQPPRHLSFHLRSDIRECETKSGWIKTGLDRTEPSEEDDDDDDNATCVVLDGQEDGVSCYTTCTRMRMDDDMQVCAFWQYGLHSGVDGVRM